MNVASAAIRGYIRRKECGECISTNATIGPIGPGTATASPGCSPTERYGQAGLNDRQVLVVNRLLDGFEGKLTTSKYATLARTSPDTALRDINALMELGILVRGPEGGRSTGYVLADRDTHGL